MRSSRVDSLTAQEEINTPVVPSLDEPSSRLSHSLNTSAIDDEYPVPVEQRQSILNSDDETFEELDEPQKCFFSFISRGSLFNAIQHKKLNELSMIEEKSMIQQDDSMEETMLDDSFVEAEPLYYDQSMQNRLNPTLVEFDSTEQFVTLRNQNETLSEDDLYYCVQNNKQQNEWKSIHREQSLLMSEDKVYVQFVLQEKAIESIIHQKEQMNTRCIRVFFPP